MGYIKSAREIAEEKVERIGAVTEEERLKWKYVPEGEKLGAKYIKDNCNIAAELNQHEEKARNYVIAGAKDILVRNIDLPRNESARRNGKKAMDGLKMIINDKVAAENIFSNIRRVLDHYTGQGEQQRKQARESLKAEYEAKIQQAMQQQLGSTVRARIDVEKQPGFHEEWRKMLVQLDSQYFKLLDEYKQELLNLS